MAHMDKTTKPGHADFRLLSCLSENGGSTSGKLARQMGYSNVRSFGQLVRLDLLRMEKLGWVGRLDDETPVAWIRTPLGTDVMNA